MNESLRTGLKNKVFINRRASERNSLKYVFG